MASTLFSKLSPTQGTTTDQDLAGLANNLVNQIMGSINPQMAFDSFVTSNPNAQKAMNIVKQYGNGDPQAAFEKYVQSTGQNAFASQIKAKLGLK